MAEKRMFAKSIVLSDAFLDMPMSARCLYFTLGMLADDDGFVGAPKSIMRQCGASQDDLCILISKRFVLAFDTGVIVIKHWRINNYLRQDRYVQTTYRKEKATLKVDSKGAYTEFGIPGGIPAGIPSIEEKRIELREEEINPVITDAKETSVFPTLLLDDGSEYSIPDDLYKKLKPLFPDVDLVAELRKMSAWCLSNPSKRKTRRGITRFINSWLSSEQDKAEKQKARESGTSNIFLQIAEERHDNR